MECKFVVGQRVVCVDDSGFREWEKLAPQVGGIYTIAGIGLWPNPNDQGPYKSWTGACVRLAEFQRLKKDGTPSEVGYAVPRFRALRDLDFWIGEEAANRLKSGRGLEIQEHSDDPGRGKVRLPQGGGSLD